MIYLVLGMHKSGTSLVSNLLHHSGINMVELEQGTYENDGFYERDSTYQMNLKLLGIPYDAIYLHPAPEIIQMKPEYEQDIQHIIAQNSQKYGDWGFKDPRTCLVYTAWEKQLPEHTLIVVFRPIEDVWPRFQYNGLNLWKNLRNAFLLVQHWCNYNQHILNILKATKMNYIVLSYQELMKDDNRELKRLQSFLGKDIADRREKSMKFSSRTSWVLSIARWIHRHRYQAILQELKAYQKKIGVHPL